MKRWQLGQIQGITIWFTLNSLLLSGLLWLIFAAAGTLLFELSLGQAVVVGFTAVLLHWLGDLLHHMGHGWVARRLGYPMQSVMSWLVLFSSRYPKDEPPLHATIHIKRALGGPAASLVITLVAGLFLFLGPAQGSAGYVLLAFVFWENLLVFFLGAFVPLGFTDGSTLLTWWPRRHEPQP
ncbi:MAG: hypothetical protein H6652_26105 [Ardenticatenaceae bacterium]|nr:hypothetical protein [Ardenticatenaceae bacterium]